MSAHATIYDVAAKAGVSISTVSLALNSPSRVNPATHERVMAAIDALGFVPKAEAVTRARRGIGRIGVIAPFTSHASFARRLNGILRAAQDQRVEIVVYDQESAATSPLVSLPLTRRVDGVIVMTVPLSDAVAQRLLDQHVATVLIEQRHPRFSGITVDNVAAGRMVAGHFVERGHRRCGFIGHVQHIHEYVLQSQERLDGFRAGLLDAGLELTEDDVRIGEYGFETARREALELLGRPERPTAVFTHDDLLASGVLHAARELGLDVPGDLMVVGFDDSDLAAPLGLTSVRQPLEESGQLALELLQAQLANPRRSVQNTMLGLELVERETTRAGERPPSS
jgi:DNA-binding LacI/PurR family transcriptional regulator